MLIRWLMMPKGFSLAKGYDKYAPKPCSSAATPATAVTNDQRLRRVDEPVGPAAGIHAP